jgi:hypothetical protein
MGFRAVPVPFEVNGQKFQVVLGDTQVNQIERELQVGLNDAFNMMGRGFMSASTVIIMATVKVGSEIGFVPIQLHEVALVMAMVETGELDENGEPIKVLPLGPALVEAQAALGNALGFAAPLPQPSESGSDLASPSKTSSRKKTG